MMRVYPPATFTWRAAQAGARALSPSSDPMKLLSGALIVADTTVLFVSSVGAYVLRHGTTGFPLEVMSITLLAIALTLNAIQFAGGYGRTAAASAAVQVGAVVRTWTLVIATLLIVAYFTKTSEEFSRAWALGWYAGALVGLTITRVIAAGKVQRWRRGGRLARTVAIVDLSGSGDRLARRLQRSTDGTVRLVGVFGPERLGDRKDGVEDLLAIGRMFRIDEILVAVSGAQDGAHGGATDAIVRRLGTLPTNVRLCPDLPAMTVVPREAELLFGEPMLTVYHRPMTGWNRVAKRAEDVVLASCGLLVLAPVLALVAVLIKLDSPGPVLFRQRRAGFNNNVIVVYKFRSMRHQTGPEIAVPQAKRNDARITRLGAFLRKSSIDELPQLLNVLRGEMSLVGPRPHAVAHNDQYAPLIDDYLGRHRMQPGITGWAQVNGLRGETETLDKMRRRVEHDLAYIDGWSLALDVKILFLTLFAVVSDRNVY